MRECKERRIILLLSLLTLHEDNIFEKKNSMPVVTRLLVVRTCPNILSSFIRLCMTEPPVNFRFFKKKKPNPPESETLFHTYNSSTVYLIQKFFSTFLRTWFNALQVYRCLYNRNFFRDDAIIDSKKKLI